MKHQYHSPLSPVAIMVVVALSHMFADAASAQAAPPWVKLARGPAFEMSEVAGAADKPDEVTVHVPLILLPKIKPEDVTIKLLDVRLGNRYVQELEAAFTVTEKVSTAPGHGPFISIKVESTKALAQGTYNLLIEAATPSHLPPQLLELQLSRPAAKLKSQPTLVVERVLTPLFEPEEKGLSMTLSEDSGLTSVTNLKSTARDFLGDRGQVISSTIDCPSLPQQIAPGGAEKLSFALVGDFPLGTSRGTVEIRSPQLAEAFPIAFEVHTRRAPWLILLIIILGLMVGYLLRTLLQQRVKLGEMRLQGFTLRDRMRHEAARRPDEVFRCRIDAAVVTLNAVLEARKADELVEAMVNLDTELRDALKQFEERRNKAQEEVDSFEKLVKTRWNLPAGVRAVVEEAGARAEGLRAQLLGDNVKAVEDVLDEARANLAEKLGRTLNEWRGAQKISLEMLDRSYLPDTVSTALGKDVTEAQELLEQAADLIVSPTFEDMSAVLGITHRCRARLSDLFKKLQRWLQYESGEFLQILRKTTVTDATSLADLEKVTANFTSELAALNEPEGAATLLTPERLSQLNAVWREALEKQMEGTESTDDEQRKVTTLLDKRKYTEAARAAFVVIEQQRREQLSRSRPGAFQAVEVATVSPLPTELLRSGDGAPPSPPAPIRVVRAESIPEPVEPGRVRTYRELLRAKFLQFALTGLGIALIGYLLFEGKFVGTFADVAGIFIWAFGLDVTVDTLLRVAKGAEPRSGS